MQILRVMIAALDPGRTEALLNPERYRVETTLRDGLSLADAVRDRRPDLLILQSGLPGLDGFAALDALSKQLAFEFPHVVLLLPQSLSQWAQRAEADAVLYTPFDGEQLRGAMEEALSRPLPRAAAATENARRDLLSALIDALHPQKHLKGREALLCCADLCAASARMREDFEHLLYPAVGALLSASPAAVEKNIRTLIENTWLSGDLHAIQRLFGLSVDAERGKPTNRECVLMLAQHAMNALRR